MAVLDTIEEDGCQEISNQMGTHLLRGLANLRSEFEVRLCRRLLIFYFIVLSNSWGPKPKFISILKNILITD